ncbi:protein cornichon homolog 4-like isoform X2 [Momordica charantia]|uniref:Protein cornichon homolog 4-like isoform X2 n=1 Tax=Momordica charantia TaxID=3673 RepID=A0A6J1DFZ1_MOMCH|nr:protein cornichon homolog 4-like isoform X2 [Momordica charantia]XP_022152841.1 protein cornichon homolog 4-like isoform X2 [Momordica charantia]
MGDLFAWLFNLFILIFLLLILGYQNICLVDLESDYINLFDSTSRINRVVLLEFVAQAVFCFVHLLARHWFMFLVSLPCLCFNIRLYVRKEHLADVTEIYNQIGWEKKQRMISSVGALEKNWDI